MEFQQLHEFCQQIMYWLVAKTTENFKFPLVYALSEIFPVICRKCHHNTSPVMQTLKCSVHDINYTFPTQYFSCSRKCSDFSSDTKIMLRTVTPACWIIWLITKMDILLM